MKRLAVVVALAAAAVLSPPVAAPASADVLVVGGIPLGIYGEIRPYAGYARWCMWAGGQFTVESDRVTVASSMLSTVEVGGDCSRVPQYELSYGYIDASLWRYELGAWRGPYCFGQKSNSFMKAGMAVSATCLLPPGGAPGYYAMRLYVTWTPSGGAPPQYLSMGSWYVHVG